MNCEREPAFLIHRSGTVRWGSTETPLTKRSKFLLAILCLLLVNSAAWAQQRRKVIINQDGSGPGGSNMQTLALLIQSPQVEVLGITVVSGNQWRDEEVAHTLRWQKARLRRLEECLAAMPRRRTIPGGY